MFDEQISTGVFVLLHGFRVEEHNYGKSRLFVRILVVQTGKEESLASMLQFPG